jgi:DNA-directed RNA polymerase subunit M/transcription elongation factor TFIIS
MSLTAVLLKQSGDIESIVIGGGGAAGKGKKAAALQEFTIETIQSKLLKKKKGLNSLTLLGKYQWKQKTLFLIGWIDGPSTLENQHHLPPPLDGITIYDDCLVIASESKQSYATPVSFQGSEYESFYTAHMEGEGEEVEEEDDTCGGGAVDDADDVLDSDVDNDEVEEEIEEEEEVEEEEEEEEEDECIEDVEVEEEHVPVKRKTVSATTKRRIESKKKSATLSALPFLATVSTDEEVTSDSIEPPFTPPTHAVRSRVYNVILSTFQSSIPCEYFERLLWNATLDACDRKKLRKSWQTIGFKDMYMSMCRTMIGNLSPTSYIHNTGLWQMVESGEITLESLVKKNSYELFPDTWQSFIDQQAKREQIQLEGDKTRATDRFQCKRCGKRETTYYELQTRSADEPMTIFINCIACGKRWTQ